MDRPAGEPNIAVINEPGKSMLEQFRRGPGNLVNAHPRIMQRCPPSLSRSLAIANNMATS